MKKKKTTAKKKTAVSKKTASIKKPAAPKKISGSGAVAVNAKQVMSTNVKTIATETSVAEMISLLRSTKFSGFPVVDQNQKAVGLISQNDILRALAHLVKSDVLPADFQETKRKASARLLETDTEHPLSIQDLLAMPVKELMTPEVFFCSPSDSLTAVSRKMTDQRVHRIVVLEAGKVVGMISATDIVRWVSGLK